MPVLNGDIINIYNGTETIVAVHDVNGIIWPRNYIFVLVPTWTYNSSVVSTLPEIPARGGDVYVSWSLVARRMGATVYSETVTPTSYSISDTTNFSYTVYSGATWKWHANDRGSNGYSSSTTRPTSAQWDSPARSCTLNASYVGSVTISGQVFSVNVFADTATLTQQRNQGTYYTNKNTYDNYSVWLDNYYDSSHLAPACEAVTNANGSCRCGNYIKWTSNSIEYYYETLGTFYFSFSCSDDWIQIDDDEITVVSRGRTPGSQRYTTITGRLNPSWYPGATTTKTATIYQAENLEYPLPASCSSLSITGFKKNGSTIQEISPCTQTTVTCTFKATWTEAGTKWTAYYDGAGDPNAIAPGAQHTNDTSITPSSDLAVAGADSTTTKTFTVTNIHTLSKKRWTVEATYLGMEASETIDQVADSKTYGATKDFSVTITKSNDTVWAGGGSATLTLYAWHTAYDYWNSGGSSDVVPDSVERKNDYASASVNSGGTRFSLGSRSTGTDSSGYRYSRYTVTHSDMTNNETTDSVVYIASNDTQNPSSRPTVSLSATNSRTYGTPVFVAKYDGNTTTVIEAYQYSIVLQVTCPVSWTSLYPDPGLTTSDFQLYITAKANNGYRTYSSISSNGEMTFGSLERNERSAGTTSFRAENIHTANAILNLTEHKNDRGQGTVISDTAGPKVTDSTYKEYDYSNYSLSISLSQYNSSSSAAPFAAATYNGIFSCTASGHKERTMTEWHQDHTVVTKYTWDSLLEDTVTTYPRETGIDEGSWNNVPDTPTITPAQNWLSISGSDVTVGANSGAARSCAINASVSRLDGGSAITNSVTFYQKKYVAISVSESSLIFAASGGTATFVVSYSRTTFTITHSGQGTSDPVYSLSSTSGGSSSNTGTKTITVTVRETSSTTNLIGLITIIPAETELSDQYIDVSQDAYIQGALTGIGNAEWINNYTASCEWILRNTNNVSKTVSLTMYIRSTTTTTPPDQGASTLEKSFSLGSKTVPAGSLATPSEISGSSSRSITRVSGKYYWISIQGTGVTYQWYQFEEPAT